MRCPFFHAVNAHIPSLYGFPRAYSKGIKFAAVERSVEFSAFVIRRVRVVQPAGVMHLDLVAVIGDGLLAGAYLGVNYLMLSPAAFGV